MSKTAPKSQYKGHASSLWPLSLRRRLFLGALWGLWALLLLAAVLLAYGWTQRYHYIEQAAEYILAEEGIAADLSVVTLTGDGVQLKDVSLRDGKTGDLFFAADYVQARYKWRDALNGRIDYIKFTRPHIMVEFDETGQMVGGWIPPSQGEGRGDGIVFPKDGFHIEDARLDIKTPYGNAAPRFDAQIFSLDNFNIEGELPPTAMSYNDIKANLSGPVTLKAGLDTYDASFDFQFSGLEVPKVTAENGGLEGDVKLVRLANKWRVTGPIIIDAAQLKSGAFAVSDLHVKTQNDVTLPLTLTMEALKASGAVNYTGDIDIAAINLSVEDTELADKFAAQLSLTQIFEKSPILREFAPRLQRQTAQRLDGQDIAARVSLRFSESGLDLSAVEPLTFKQADQTWSLSPIGDAPLVSIKPSADIGGAPYQGKAQFNFNKSGALPLSLTAGQAQFTLGSLVGAPLLSQFSARLALPSRWKSTDVDGVQTRLSTPQTDILLIRGAGETKFTAATQFSITGDVPGGRVEVVRGQGELAITTKNGRSHMVYTPRGRMTFARMDLTSGWILEDGDLRLSKPFQMTGPAQERVIDIEASDVTARIHDGGERDFQLTLQQAKGQGVLKTAKREGLSQSWDMTLSGAQLTSETFPITMTDIFSPSAKVSVNMTSGKAPQFDIQSPQTRIASSLVSAQQIAVAAKGTADNLVVDYDAKRFVFSDPALPEIPMAGQTRLIAGRWTGESIARLPEDPDTPIDIQFSFADGVGTADINIAALQFTPGKLQPQNLVSALRGKIGEVEGAVSTSIQLGFGEGRPLTSSGRTVIENLNFGTLPGPIKGMNAELEFTSMFPLETSGRQIVRVQSFDPGFPLQDGEIEFEILPGAMKIYRADWPMAGGRIYIEPLTWSFTAPSNKAVLVLDEIPIQNIVERKEDSKFEMTGAISGRLPVTVSGVNVAVEGGKLSVPGGGVIKVTSAATDVDGANTQGALGAVAGKEVAAAGDAVGRAFAALKNFQYESLEADISGPLDGLVRLQALFSGYNEDVLNKQPFEFDLDFEGELFNLIRELNPETQRKRAVSGQLLTSEPP